MFDDLASYYLRWYHDRPVGITSQRRDELRRLHGILYRCAEYFALHYTGTQSKPFYLEVMLQNEAYIGTVKTQSIVAVCALYTLGLGQRLT